MNGGLPRRVPCLQAGAFYANFDTKEDLFFALLYEEAEKHSRQIRVAVSCGNTAKKQLAAVRDYYVQCMAGHT